MPATAVLAPDRSSPSQELEWMPTPVDALEASPVAAIDDEDEGDLFYFDDEDDDQDEDEDDGFFFDDDEEDDEDEDEETTTTTSWSPTKMSHPKTTMMKKILALGMTTTRNMSSRTKPLLRTFPSL